MKKLLIIGLLLFPIVGYAGKEDIGDYDGNNWESWSTTKRLSFLEGFFSASGFIVSDNQDNPYYSSICCQSEFNPDIASNVWTTFYDFASKNKKTTLTRKDVALLLDSEIVSRNSRLFSYGIYKITIGQIHEGLNLFYSDFRNKQIKLPSGIHVVKKQIEGTSSEELEAIVQWLRGGGKDYKKRFYIDKEGKKKYVSFP